MRSDAKFDRFALVNTALIQKDHLWLKRVHLCGSQQWLQSDRALAFIFVQQGAGRCSTGSGVEEVVRGDVIVINGSVRTILQARDGQALNFAVFSVSLEQMFPLFAPGEIRQLERVSDSLKGGRVFPASESVALRCHRLLTEVPAEAGLDHRSQLLRVASVVIADELRRQPDLVSGFVPADEHIQRVINAISAQELLEMSVDDLARRFGCSRRHLNRLFHLYFGFSVSGLKLEMRMLKAVSLLRNPDAKVVNVAEECGYNHLNLFNSCFKRRFGLSPREYRATILNGDRAQKEKPRHVGVTNFAESLLASQDRSRPRANNDARGSVQWVREIVVRSNEESRP